MGTERQKLQRYVTVIRGYAADLDREVNEMFEKGYRPYGTQYTSHEGYCQPMLLLRTMDKK